MKLIFLKNHPKKTFARGSNMSALMRRLSEFKQIPCRTLLMASSNIRQNIFLWAIGVAVVLNLDKILLGPWALIRFHDTFDGPMQARYIFAQNILKYGFISQSPEQVCGFSSLTYATAPFFYALMMFLPLYPSYIFLSLLSMSVAFSGIFLLLHDEFKLNQTASLVGALFFSSIESHLVLGISIVGIPLLIWCFERIFDITSSLKKRLVSYLYILFYFSASIFAQSIEPLFLLYFFYFIFLSNIKKTPGNILTISLILCLFGLINLPGITELFNCVPTSQRISWDINLKTWGYAAETFMTRLFFIKMEGEYISTPSLLGIFLILFYFISIKKADKNKFYYFPIYAVLAVEFFAFYLYNSPFWKALTPFLGFLESWQFDRVYFLLAILFSILIGQASHYLITHDSFSCKRSWYFTTGAFLLYIVVGVGFRQFPLDQFILQGLSLAVLILLLCFNYLEKIKYSTGKILVISFIFFSIANTLYGRYIWGPFNFQNLTKSPQIELIKHREGNNLDRFRVATIKGTHQALLLLNGFKCADGFLNVYPEAYKEYWAKVIDPEIKKSTFFGKYFLDFGCRVYLFDSSALDVSKKNRPLTELSFNPELLRLINVKYIISDEKILNCEKYGLIEVAERSKAYVNAPKWKRYFRPWEFYVYQNTDYSAPAFLTGAVRLFDGKDALLDELGKENYKYLSAHTFALRGEAPILENAILNSAQSEIIDTQLKPDEMTVRLKNRYPVILNWTTNYNRNWICEIDGRRVPIFKIYNAFMGVLVPPDSHQVKFKYHNILLTYAYWICIVGFVFINVYVVISLRRLGT